jgi:hypothetical protein
MGDGGGDDDDAVTTLMLLGMGIFAGGAILGLFTDTLGDVWTWIVGWLDVG